MDPVLLNIISIAAVIIVIGTFFLPKKVQYMLHAFFLLLLGSVPILYYFKVIGFSMADLVALRYIITLVVVMSGRELIVSGMHENHKGIRHASIAIGVVIITITVVPALATFGAITFSLPQYPAAIDSILYITGSILLFAGTFLAGE